MNITLQQYILQVEESLLNQIISDVREEKMILGEAKYLAKDFLSLLPVNNKGELLNKLYALVNTYPQAKIIFSKYIGEFEEEKTAQKLAVLRTYMQKKDYDHAVQAIKEIDYNG